MEFTVLLNQLKEPSTAKRKQTWKSLPQRHAEHPFSPSEVRRMQALLLDEVELDVRTTGMVFLEMVMHLQGPELKESFQSWLFNSFRNANGESRASRKRSVVVAVCDDEYIRDVQAQVEVARHLPADRYPDTEFRHVALHTPEWDHVGLDRADAICFIGRPSLFRHCSIIEQFPNDLRFSIVPPGPEETETFHRLCQNRPRTADVFYPTTQDASKRHDYAIVQRFPITFGGRKVTVVVIAGGSSLGTFGAAQWITQFDWCEERRKEFVSIADVAGNGMAARVEVLLSVSGTVHSPARPWEAHAEGKSLYLNKSRNLLKAPKRISVATDSGALQSADDVRYLLFDDDEVELGGLQSQAAVAVCVKYILDGQAEMPIAKLMTDKRVWARGVVPDRSDPAGFFRDHLQRRSFNGIIEVSQSHDILNLKLGNGAIEVIRAKSNDSNASAPSA